MTTNTVGDVPKAHQNQNKQQSNQQPQQSGRQRIQDNKTNRTGEGDNQATNQNNR